jgi:hypothetical protein
VLCGLDDEVRASIVCLSYMSEDSDRPSKSRKVTVGTFVGGLLQKSAKIWVILAILGLTEIVVTH